MRVFLIVLVTLSYLGGIRSIIAFNGREGRPQFDMILMMFFISILNAWSARYLFGKATKNKIEWALFAFLGNINAIFIHWFYTSAKEQWIEGKHFWQVMNALDSISDV